MISELRGTLAGKGPGGIVIDVNGFGCFLLVPLSTFRDLPEEGDKIHLYTHLHVREDALELYGFLRKPERVIFRELISVSGIGPKLGLAVLSGLSPDVFHEAVVHEDVALLTSISGIGKKTAQRLIVELKERLSGLDVSSIVGDDGSDGSVVGDAVLALVSLGMSRSTARESTLRVQREAGEELPLEDLIKRVLRT